MGSPEPEPQDVPMDTQTERSIDFYFVGDIVIKVSTLLLQLANVR
jgi:hypothetical protein